MKKTIFALTFVCAHFSYAQSFTCEAFGNKGEKLGQLQIGLGELSKCMELPAEVAKSAADRLAKNFDQWKLIEKAKLSGSEDAFKQKKKECRKIVKLFNPKKKAACKAEAAKLESTFTTKKAEFDSSLEQMQWKIEALPGSRGAVCIRTREFVGEDPFSWGHKPGSSVLVPIIYVQRQVSSAGFYANYIAQRASIDPEVLGASAMNIPVNFAGDHPAGEHESPFQRTHKPTMYQASETDFSLKCQVEES